MNMSLQHMGREMEQLEQFGGHAGHAEDAGLT